MITPSKTFVVANVTFLLLRPQQSIALALRPKSRTTTSPSSRKRYAERLMLLLFLPIFLAFWILYHSIQASPWLRARLRRFLFPKLARLLAPPSDDEDDDDEPYTIRTTWIGILVSTTRLNGEAEEWVNIRMGPRGRRWMRMFYEWLGLIFGIVGMTLVVTGLIIQSGKLAGDLWELVRSVREEKRALGRRQLDVQPLIPGITLPLAHAPYLIFAFLASQLIHEPAHALAAALSSISPILISLHLSPILPSASVTLPSLELWSLPPFKRASIAAAGCWHNILAAGLFWGMLSSMGGVLETFVGREGRVVTWVAKDSPLALSLPIGTLVTSLDDLSLIAESPDDSDDLWSHYLLRPEASNVTGWCIGRDFFLAQPTDCCSSPFPTTDQPTLCFRQSPFSEGHCLLPQSILTTPRKSNDPASPACPCEPNEPCVRPDERELILRLTTLSLDGRQEVVVWQGRKEVVFEQVITSSLLPPTTSPSLFPIYTAFRLALLYLTTISVTLALLNLLPISLLDGGLLLESLIEHRLSRSGFPRTDWEALLPPEAGDEEEGEGSEPSISSTTRRRRGSRRIAQLVSWVTLGLTVWLVLGLVVKSLVTLSRTR